MTKIGIIGSGVVGTTLASGFLKHGYEVKIGSRDPKKLENWLSENPDGSIGGFEETAAFGDILVLAVKGTIAKEALNLLGADNINGKIILDATNPIADAAPENGVLKFFTTLDKSLLEELQEAYADTKLVKAFSSVGAHLMVNPQLELKPSMFIAGNDEDAKKTVGEILDQFGWETEDMGPATGARAIEPLCMLWCIPGLAQNQWNHAFKLLKA